MPDKYILDSDGNPVKEPNLLKWAEWYETADRDVAKDTIGDVVVSTYFLGLDFSLGVGPLQLYETTVCGAENDSGCRYENRVEALAGHDVILHSVRYFQTN